MDSSTPLDAPGFLPYKSVDLYFIYSFVLELRVPTAEYLTRLDDLGWIAGPPSDRKGRPPFLNVMAKDAQGRLTEKSRSLCVLEVADATVEYRECDRESFELSLAEAKTRRPHPLAHPEDPRKSHFSAGVEAWARLFDNGAGCLTFRIRLEEDITFRRVYETLSLSQRVYDRRLSTASVSLDDEEGNLFVHFQRLVRKIVRSLNGDEEECQFVTLQDERILDLGAQRDGVERSKDRPGASEPDAQNPYVLTVVELEEEGVPALFFQKRATEALHLKELTAILFRLVYPADFFRDLRRNLEFVHIPSELLIDGVNIRNYAWDSRSLMCFTKTSSLLVCVNKYRIPAVLIRYSLLNSLEILRTRWHMSILISAELDADLDVFRSEASEANLDVLEMLVRRRKRFAAFLHDPLPYAFEGGSVAQIADAAARELGLADLRRMALDKFATLNQLHSDQMKLASLRYFGTYTRDMDSRNRSRAGVEKA